MRKRSKVGLFSIFMTPQRKTLIHINYVGLLLEVSETSHAYGCECMHERMSASRLCAAKKAMNGRFRTTAKWVASSLRFWSQADICAAKRLSALPAKADLCDAVNEVGEGRKRTSRRNPPQRHCEGGASSRFPGSAAFRAIGPKPQKITVKTNSSRRQQRCPLNPYCGL